MYNINIRRVLWGVVIGSLLLMVVILAISTYQARKQIVSLQDYAIQTNNKVAALELELSNFKNYTHSEFESSWRSFARIRNNFLAIGHGYHLEEKDIAPQEEVMMAGRKEQ